MVQAGEAVVKGDLLASGLTATAQETLVRRSAGIVMAETRRELTVSVPLREDQFLPGGEALRL